MGLTPFVATLIAADNPHNAYVYTIRFVALPCDPGGHH
jgi:hypothetical protein